METGALAREIVETYRRHGWELRCVLLRPETRNGIDSGPFGEAAIREAPFDAMWFARASHAGREAWELRLLAEQRYALFEAFEHEETEDAREEVRCEMENRMREYLAK